LVVGIEPGIPSLRKPVKWIRIAHYLMCQLSSVPMSEQCR
jgi:hypothetical protein